MTRAEAAFALALCLPLPSLADCAEGFADIRTDRGQIRFTTELADTEAERNRGLMFREAMDRFAGMLFVYEAPRDAVFWMRNTYIPLDMLFFDESGVLKTVVAEAEPRSDSPRPGGPGIRYVLEINGGLAATLGIAPGAELRSPAMDQTLAAWACAG